MARDGHHRSTDRIKNSMSTDGTSIRDPRTGWMFEGLFFFWGFEASWLLGSANPSGNVGIARFLSIATVDNVLGYFAPVHRNITGEF